MPSGLPLKEIKVLLNKPGEELDERLAKLPEGAKCKGGYQVELDGNLEKNANGELEFFGKAKTITLPTEPIGAEVWGKYSRERQRTGKSDVSLSFWFTVEVN